ncbi:MAG: DsrE family protein [Pirellulales bacterium]
MRQPFLLPIILFVTLTTSAVAQESTGKNAPETGPKTNFLVEMSCAPDDEEAVCATLQMALALGTQQANVTLFIDASAVHIATPHCEAQGSALQKETDRLFAQVRKAGVTCLVCPHCAEQLAVAAEDLRKGLRMTSKEELEATRDRADQIFEYRRPSTETLERPSLTKQTHEI